MDDYSFNVCDIWFGRVYCEIMFTHLRWIDIGAAWLGYGQETINQTDRRDIIVSLVTMNLSYTPLRRGKVSLTYRR